MDKGFLLTQPVYTPAEVARIYTTHVRHVSYATVLEWIKIYSATQGQEGIQAHRSPRGRYTVTAAELERVLQQAGAMKQSES